MAVGMFENCAWLTPIRPYWYCPLSPLSPVRGLSCPRLLYIVLKHKNYNIDKFINQSMKVLTICKLIKNVSRIDLSLILSYLILLSIIVKVSYQTFMSYGYHFLHLYKQSGSQVTGTVKNKYHSGTFKFAYMLTSVICKA